MNKLTRTENLIALLGVTVAAICTTILICQKADAEECFTYWSNPPITVCEGEQIICEKHENEMICWVEKTFDN